MAMALGVLMSLVFGGVEFGYYVFVKHAIQAATREGARTAVLVGSTNSSVTTAVSNAMTNAGLSGSGYTLTTSPTDITTAASGSEITVTVSCTWGVVGQGVRPLSLISSTKVMSVSVVMLKEG
jgi:Flp pilus assembly protein TadG